MTWGHEIHAHRGYVGTKGAHAHNTTFSGCLFYLFDFIYLFNRFCFVFLTSSHPLCLPVMFICRVSIYLPLFFPSLPLDVFMSVCSSQIWLRRENLSSFLFRVGSESSTSGIAGLKCGKWYIDHEKKDWAENSEKKVICFHVWQLFILLYVFCFVCLFSRFDQVVAEVFCVTTIINGVRRDGSLVTMF